MKKIMWWLGAALIATSCSQTPQKSLLQAELSGMTADDSVLVKWGEFSDTLAAPNGVFTYEYKDSVAGRVMFFEIPKRLSDGHMEAFRMTPMVVLMQPNQPLKVKGSFEKYEVTGNDFYEAYNAACRDLSDVDSLRQVAKQSYMSLLQNNAPKEEINAKFEEVKKVDKTYQEQVIKYVSQHLDSEAALYLLYLNSSAEGADYIEKFSPAVKKGALKDIYADLSKYYAKMLARKKAAEFIKVGKPAPDFTLASLDGKPFTLSSLRGKYVVLDFWGSWCGWCIKGFPEMKEMYEKYKGKLEVVGIDCRDSEDKWKAAVEKHALPWINVINGTDGEKDMTTVYNIGGYPTKLIVDPEGNIAEIVVGESPEFYDCIRELMSK